MLKKIFITVVGALLILNSCNSNPVIPPEIQPGRRDYTWTVDTVNYPNYLTRIWGSSPTDVWCVGPAGDLYRTIWHFDGEKWSTDNIFRPISPASVFGFSNDNVYIGTGRGKIWHFDGTVWTEVAALTKDGHNNIAFDNMWGESPNDFYAFGAYAEQNNLYNNSVIAHYSSSNWTILNTDGLQGIVERFYRNEPDRKFYVQTYKIGGGQYPDSTLIYEYTPVLLIPKKYNRIYGSIETKGQQADISVINGEVYFVLGNEIAKRVNNKFQTYLTVDNPNFYQRIWGRNSKDIFLLMTDGLAHYNGNDIEYLFYFNKPRTQIYIGGAALFDSEVFFLADEFSTGLYLIYHEKLNDRG
ncbi:hypothetical protein ABRY23_14365 [Melioribacteraceae bacterium 4301-Me]|uniref:hypothetical protein n=1 Tax=Pyranulibacter aquaticus TaxID=3163344 RepID=UPI003599D805